MVRCSRAVLFPLTVLVLQAQAQNLVPNGGFEDYSVCPGSYSRTPSEFQVTSWTSSGTGSPDYFNACSNGEADVPYNWAGVSDASEGSGYAGIYMWVNLGKEYREYLHCRLDAPLTRDSLYHITFRYKLSSYSKFCIDRIGLLITDNPQRYPHDKPPGITPTLAFVRDSALTLHTGTWELAAAKYQARGGEQFLTIGNFSTNNETRSYHIRSRPGAEPMLAGSAYYYVDDVRVLPASGAGVSDQELQALPLAGAEAPLLETVYVLRNIRFEFNSHRLVPGASEELDRIAHFMLGQSAVKVKVEGHTDESGDAGYNLLLSERRAESVAAYLRDRGVTSDRITALGHGETRPLAATVGAANRRVEIEFLP